MRLKAPTRARRTLRCPRRLPFALVARAREAFKTRAQASLECSLVITVVDYDPAWPRRFEALRLEYGKAMAEAGVPVVAIEHVGSTSVPGLAAKPVVDCDIIVAEADVSAASDVLVSLGFGPLGELGIPLRWAFKEPSRFPGTNTYVVVDGSLSLRNHLVVRDTLRADADLRERVRRGQETGRRIGGEYRRLRPWQERHGPEDPRRRRVDRHRARLDRQQPGAVAR